MACAISVDPDILPSYFQFITGIIKFVMRILRESFSIDEEYEWQMKDVQYFNITVPDIILVAFLSSAFTFLRRFVTIWFFQPVSNYYGLTPINKKKMPESAWKFSFYLISWSYCCYVLVLSGNYCFFQKPSTVYDDWNLEHDVPLDIYVIYVLQAGFYFHSVYATIFIDAWKKDFAVMMAHHVVTLALITFSYSLRYQNLGSVVILLHDVCDIVLEFTKLNVYFKIQHEQPVKVHAVVSNVGFFCFGVLWFITRLYWYPLKVIYSSTSLLLERNLHFPCELVINLFLWALQLMNIYWFMFVLSLLKRVLTGQVREVEDNREYDVEASYKNISAEGDKECRTDDDSCTVDIDMNEEENPDIQFDDTNAEHGFALPSEPKKTR